MIFSLMQNFIDNVDGVNEQTNYHPQSSAD